MVKTFVLKTLLSWSCQSEMLVLVWYAPFSPLCTQMPRTPTPIPLLC
jgi:hypothetical protein